MHSRFKSVSLYKIVNIMWPRRHRRYLSDKNWTIRYILILSAHITFGQKFCQSFVVEQWNLGILQIQQLLFPNHCKISLQDYKSFTLKKKLCKFLFSVQKNYCMTHILNNKMISTLLLELHKKICKNKYKVKLARHKFSLNR